MSKSNEERITQLKTMIRNGYECLSLRRGPGMGPMLKEANVSFELAKKLKEKGFPQDVFIGYDEFGTLCIGDEHSLVCAALTISQVLKWLREAKRIDAGAVWDNRDGKWIGYINEMNMPDLVGEYVLPNTYDSYEQAALAGIEYVLDNLI